MYLTHPRSPSFLLDMTVFEKSVILLASYVITKRYAILFIPCCILCTLDNTPVRVALSGYPSKLNGVQLSCKNFAPCSVNAV